MKRISVFVLIVILILSACNSSKLSFSEIEIVPDNVQESIDSNFKLQSITDGGKGYYIVFHSSGEVKYDLVTEGKKVIIKFNETNFEENNVKQYTYYLTTDPEHDQINVLVNDKEMPFDNITAQ